MRAPLVSVGIPTYNRVVQLEECITRVLKQTYRNIEFIISDNHSQGDEVKCLLESFSKKDTRINYYIQPKNIEGEPNFNYVFNNAHGDYFIWLSDDDYFQEDYIEKCVDFLENNIDYISCAGISRYTMGGIIVSEEKGFSIENEHWIVRFFNYFYHVEKNGIFYGVFRRSGLSENPIGKFLGSDWCVVATLAMKGKIKTLYSTFIYRSMDGGSANRKSMIRRWKLNKLNTLFFETYAAFCVTKNIFKDQQIEKKINVSLKALLQSILFIFINIKFLTNSIKRRL